jgi:hypothetical protein
MAAVSPKKRIILILFAFLVAPLLILSIYAW